MPQQYGKLALLQMIKVIFCFLLFSNIIQANSEFPFKIDKIEIQGLKKVEKEAILEGIFTREGDQATSKSLREDIRRIYKLNYFSNIEAHKEVLNGRNLLIFKVKERPLISEIVIDGNDNIKEEDLKEQLKIKPFSILDVSAINRDVFYLQQFYEGKGHFLATVDYKIEKVSEENVRVRFSISEKQNVKVKKITFLGNTNFSDSELKDFMATREQNIFSALGDSGSFKDLDFRMDIERLKQFYQIKGFLQINIGNPEVTISEDKKWIFITIKVNEGPQFQIHKIFFKGETLFSDEKFLSELTIKEDEIYAEDKVAKDIIKLSELYQDEGYAFANVQREILVVPGENKVDIQFSFEKGKKVSFGNIHIKGNTKTRDKVIRRELVIKEGQLFSGSGLRVSKENVERIGFFKVGSVIFTTKSPSGRDDLVDVIIEVEERETGQIQLGAGYSSDKSTGFFIQGSISQNNFMGYGQNLSLNLQSSKNKKSINLGFTDLYFMDTQWTAGGDIFFTDNKEESDTFYKFGGDLRVGHPIFSYTRLLGTYKLFDTQIKGTTNNPTIINDVENGITSSFKLNLIFDKRDNIFEPSNGLYFSLGSEYAGLGGDKKWFKNEIDTRFFYNPFGDYVFRSRLFIGKNSKIDPNLDIPQSERYFLGGTKTLRGYYYRAIGPHVLASDNKLYNVGSFFTSFLTLEVEHPMIREARMKWVVFLDAGDATNDIKKFKNYMSYGVGVRWFSPLGLLRFEYGIPIQNLNGNAGGQFSFDLGQLF